MVQTGSGLGTGFIIEKEGLVVTNAHVVAHGNANVDKVVIKFTNGNKVDGFVIAFNKDKDLALIKLAENPLGYPTVKIGDSKTLSEGERIIAMGHPRGLPFSVSEGIVSGLDFRHNGHLRFIQHDAAVNPGNSGGPLFNKYGEVVAVNTAIASNAGGFDGISFSIPTEDLKKALEQFKAINNIDTAWLGAIFYPNSPNAPAFGLYVDTVRMESPSEAAGLRAGDIIVGVDDRHLSNVPEEAVAQLSLHLRGKIPTDKITLKVSRDGAVEEIVVELGVKRPNPYMEMLRIQEEITKKFAPPTK
jgi:serine protease Do